MEASRIASSPIPFRDYQWGFDKRFHEWRRSRNRLAAVGSSRWLSGRALGAAMQAFDELIELDQETNNVRGFVHAVEFAHGVCSNVALRRKRSTTGDDFLDARDQDKLEPLVKRHRIQEKRLIRVVGGVRERLRLPDIELAQFPLDPLGVGGSVGVRVHG